MRLGYVILYVPDVPASLAFYERAFGLKRRRVARAEMAAYNQTPEGMPGNDDAGEMSAWYVLAALGRMIYCRSGMR